MLAIVPLVGLLVSGSRRGAWRYTKDWARSIGILVLLGCLLYLLI